MNDGGNGQDITENLLGSILRIDVDGGTTVGPAGTSGRVYRLAEPGMR